MNDLSEADIDYLLDGLKDTWDAMMLTEGYYMEPYAENDMWTTIRSRISTYVSKEDDD